MAQLAAVHDLPCAAGGAVRGAPGQGHKYAHSFQRLQPVGMKRYSAQVSPFWKTIMSRSFGLAPVAIAASLLAACSQGEGQLDQIHLPAGDATRGEALFTSLGCVSCHLAGGTKQQESATASPKKIRLGSATGQRMSYGQLVTAIVNPSHRFAPQYFSKNVSKDGESLMNNYNDTLTVTQLTDLVAFLQTHYEDVLRPGYRYPVYSSGRDSKADE